MSDSIIHCETDILKQAQETCKKRTHNAKWWYY